METKGYEVAMVVFRHGEDDYSFWMADFPAGTVQKARQGKAEAQGDLDAIMDAIPLGDGEESLNFLFHSEDGFSLRAVNVGEDFLEEHETDGCSVRGSRKQIQSEVLDAFAL